MFKTKLPSVSIIDYGMGNLFSVKQACEHVGLQAIIASEADDILNSEAVILPGVGAYADAIDTLNKLDLVNPIHDFIKSGKPFMGICLGFQLLMSESEEFGRHKGLDIFRGQVIKFPTESRNSQKTKVPQVGWNRINRPIFTKEGFWRNTVLADMRDGEFMYFVHSYYCKPENNEIILSLTKYADTEFCSSIAWKNICAFQFHPERSAAEGLRIYKNWSLSIRNCRDEYERKVGS